MSTHLVFPMAFYVLYMWCLAAFMFNSRVRAIKTGEVAAKYFKAYNTQPPAERTILIGRHYDNQFQVPMLFFAGCLAHMLVGKADLWTLVSAWLFIGTRLLHSKIHLGSNILQRRVAAFAAGWFVVVVLWLQLVYYVLRG